MSEQQHGEGEHKEGQGGGGHGGGGHGKKHHHHGHGHHEEHEEGWIVSFADNVLLMMGFFVILLAMNMGPKATGPEAEGEPGASSASAPSEQMLDFAIAVREAFNNPVQLDSTDPEDQALIRRLRQRAGVDAAPDSSSSPTPARGTPSERPADWHGLSGYVEFADNSADLTEPGRANIRHLAEKLVGTRWVVEVRGHASRLESWGDERKARELSYRRAWTVGQELVHQGVRWQQVLLVASGDIAPVTPRAATASEHMTNQRAEILVTPKTEVSDPYSQQPGGPPAAQAPTEGH